MAPVILGEGVEESAVACEKSFAKALSSNLVDPVAAKTQGAITNAACRAAPLCAAMERKATTQFSSAESQLLIHQCAKHPRNCIFENSVPKKVWSELPLDGDCGKDGQ